MSDDLLDPLRHNAWATKELLAFCGALTPDQLQAEAPGTYGTILSTLQHIIGADGRYGFRLAGIDPRTQPSPEDVDDLSELSRMAEDRARSWDELATSHFDPERIVRAVDMETGELYEVRAGVLVAQALNHGNEHRAQIYTILTTIGVDPPELDGWHYAMATGRFEFKGKPA